MSKFFPSANQRVFLVGKHGFLEKRRGYFFAKEIVKFHIFVMGNLIVFFVRFDIFVFVLVLINETFQMLYVAFFFAIDA